MRGECQRDSSLIIHWPMQHNLWSIPIFLLLIATGTIFGPNDLPQINLVSRTLSMNPHFDHHAGTYRDRFWFDWTCFAQNQGDLPTTWTKWDSLNSPPVWLRSNTDHRPHYLSMHPRETPKWFTITSQHWSTNNRIYNTSKLVICHIRMMMMKSWFVLCSNRFKYGNVEKCNSTWSLWFLIIKGP